MGFFNDNAYDSELGTYCSEINTKGKVVSNKVYNVALSRMIYGLSYASFIDSSNLIRADKAIGFQLKNLTANDSIGGHFISCVDTETNESDNSNILDIWQHAYGLCGLSEFYRINPSDELLLQIHRFHDTFVNRFHDKINGRFYGKSNTQTGPISGSKSLQSLMYPITAYMENLWLADKTNRHKYECINVLGQAFGQ